MRKNGKRLPEVLTEDEQARLLAQLDGQDSSSARALAILRVFLDCGLRASELINLEVKNIDWKSGRMKVRGKGDRDRVLWFNGRTHAALQAWFAVKPTSSSPLVFTGLDGNSPLCGRWLRKLVPRLAAQAGIDKRIHPHTLRHTFATNLLRQEKNLFLVSKALGHANLSTTQIYLHLEDSELEAAMKRLGG
jgi:site-specific recombinase XerD